MKNAYLGYEQSVFLNGQKLKGVNSVDGSYSLNLKPINIMGAGHFKSIVAEVLEGDFSITRYQSIPDPFLRFTGDNKFLKGSIHYGTKVFGFESGLLNSYNYSLSVGEVPQTNLGITVYGDIGDGVFIDATGPTGPTLGNLNASGEAENNDFQIIRMGDVSITCDGSTTNRVTDFNFTVSPQRMPVYIINSHLPHSMPLKYPVETIVSFTLEVDDYENRRMKDALTSCNFDTISFAVKGQETGTDVGIGTTAPYTEDFLETESNDPLELSFGQNNLRRLNTIFDFSSTNARLISETFDNTADDVATVKLTYVVYNNK